MLSLSLLGDPSMTVDGRDRPLPDRRPGRLLLAWLALHPGAHARGDVAAALWPDVLPESARASLRSALASVRRALGEEADRYVVATRAEVGLAGEEAVRVDVAAFDALVAAGAHAEAVALHRGPLLQGLDDEWVLALRAERADRLAAALEGAAAAAERAGDVRAAVDFTRRRATLDPLDEDAARALVRRLAAAGDRAGALAAHERHAAALHRQLGVAPSPATRRLAAEVRHGVGAAAPRLPPPPPLEPDPPPLAGRERELRTLAAAVTAARAGTATIALVEGEAGIGKSRLLTELAAVAHERGAQVLAGRCHPTGDVPYGPVAEALRRASTTDPLAAALSGASDSRTPADRGAASDSRPAGEGDAQSDALSPGATDGGDGARRALTAARVGHAVLSALAALSGGRAVVLLVDDAQWADPSTVRLLDHLALGAPACALAIVVAHRPVGPDSPLSAALGRWRRQPGAAQVALGGLDERATSDVAARVAGATVPATTAEALHARTGGHPLFVAELARRLAREAAWPPPPAAVAAAALPDRVSEALRERVDALGADVRRVLAIAALAGDPFTFALVAAVLGDPDRTLDALDDAVGANVLREEAPGRYAFAHDLVREAAAAALSATRRARLHHAIAGALERANAPAPRRNAEHDREDAAALRRIAEHHLAAGDLGDPPRAVEAARRAAEHARRAAAHADAAALLDRAAPLAADPRERTELLVAAGHAHRRAGHGEAARDAYAAAADLASADGDAHALVDAVLGLCAIPWFPGTEPVDGAAIGHLERALALLGDAPTAARARALAQLARERAFVAGPEATARAAAHAVAVARQTEDAAALASALDAQSQALVGQAPPATRRAAADELAALAAELDDPELGVRARVWRVLAALQQGDLGAVAPEAQALDDAAAEHGQPAWRWWPALWRAMRALHAGDTDAAEQLAWAAWELGEDLFGERAALELQTQLFAIRRAQGRLRELDAAATEAAARYAPVIPAWHAVRALVDAELGRHAEARAAIRDLTLPRDASHLVGLTLAAEVAVLTNDRDAAQRIAKDLQPHAGEVPVSGYGGLVLQPVDVSLRALRALTTSPASTTRG